MFIKIEIEFGEIGLSGAYKIVIERKLDSKISV
jgi:hypothetical protein